MSLWNNIPSTSATSFGQVIIMATVDEGHAAYRRTHSPGQLAWSEGRQPLGVVLNSSAEPGELSQSLVS